jgi:hypothetical protein
MVLLALFIGFAFLIFFTLINIEKINRYFLDNGKIPTKSCDEIGWGEHHYIVKKIIRDATLNNEKIVSKIKKYKETGLTIEEIIVIIYIFDIALIVDDWLSENTGLNGIMKLASIPATAPGELFLKWKEQGKLPKNTPVFEIISRFHSRTAYEARSVILDFLYDENLDPVDFYKLVEKIDIRYVLNMSLVSLKIFKKRDYESNTKFCLNYSVGIMQCIINASNADMNPTLNNKDEDHIIICGLFLLIFANHIARLMGVSFKVVGTASIICLFGEDAYKRHIDSIISSYNLAHTPSHMAFVARDIISKWIDEPTDEKFYRLIELYTITKKHAQVVD